jgi:phospholipid/cholesterol/gamma-HCH transport system substrate-binding protein
MDATRERTLVGLFVLIAGGLLIGAIVLISGTAGGAKIVHRAYFKFAGGVQPGASVRYGGYLVGKVERVRVDPNDSTRIEVEMTVDRDAPLKTDSVAKISTLGPLTDNYIEISTGGRQSPRCPAGGELPSAEAFGLPQLGDAAQALLPDLQRALQKLNQNLDGLQVTLTRANDLLNDRNRANIAGSIDQLHSLVAEVRPKANASLDNLNGLLEDTRPKVATTLTNVQDLTTKLAPLLADLKTTMARANDTLGHLDATLTENRADIRASVTGLRELLGKSTVLLDQVSQTFDQNSGNIDGLLENLRLTTENLRALTETLSRSPAALIRGVKAPDRKPGDIQK